LRLPAVPATSANWYMVAAQTVDALDAAPTISTVTVNYPAVPPAVNPSPLPAYSGFTASEMMGACSSNGVENGFLCGRSTDVWGVALDNEGRFQITWPQAPAGNFGCNSPCNETWVTSQTDGPTIAPNLVSTPEGRSRPPSLCWARRAWCCWRCAGAHHGRCNGAPS
jgi:hypothetical protein